MVWANSKIFVETIEDILENTTAMDLNTDTFKAALYNNTTAPSQTVVSASTAYNVDQWVIANEVSDGTEWDAGGEPIVSTTLDSASNVITFDGTNTVSGGTSATLAAVFGTLVLDDSIASPVAKQGLCYNYFGGTNSVTDGTFTIIWHGSGIMALTL